MLCSGVNAALGPPISVCTHPGLNISTLIPCGSTSFARIDIAMFNAALLDLYWYADPNPIVVPNVCSEPIPVLIATICFDAYQRRALAQHQPQHLRPACAQCCADGDLLAPLRDPVGRDPASRVTR
jgi:hypothetical protein